MGAPRRWIGDLGDIDVHIRHGMVTKELGEQGSVLFITRRQFSISSKYPEQ